MKKEQLEALVEVVDAGSISGAAKNMYVSQPSLSRTIHSLEKEVGKILIKRGNRGVSLTPAGKTVYYYARSILNQFNVIEKMKDLSVDSIYSKLTVSVDSIFLKDDLILNFYNKIKTAETEMHMIETTAENVLKNVINLESEIGVLVLNDVQLPFFKRMTEINNIEIQLLDSGPLYIHLSHKDPLGQKEIVKSTDLINHAILHLPFDFFSNLNMAISIDNIQISSIHKSIVMSNYHAIIYMLNHTSSFLLGHKWHIDELKKSNIRSVQLENCDIMKNLIVIKRKKEILSDSANLFVNLLKESYCAK